MTVSLNSVTSSASTQTYVPASAPRAAAALSAQAVGLSAQSAVVASLGGSTGATVYSAAGLLNTLQQAGTAEESIAVPEEGSNTDTSTSAQTALNQGIVSTLASSSTASGIYSVGGTNGLSDQASSNWADILKTNPNLASTVISSSFDMGVIGSLRVTA